MNAFHVLKFNQWYEIAQNITLINKQIKHKKTLVHLLHTQKSRSGRSEVFRKNRVQRGTGVFL